MSLFLFFISFTILHATQSALVKWLPNTNFNLASNFRDKRLPCSNQTVIFPDFLATSIVIEGDISLGGIVLPVTGDILLPRNGVISIGENGDSDGCIGGDSYYVENSTMWWAQPDVWSSPDFNEATPDAERIPCDKDVVEFPENSRFVVRLPDTTQHIQGLWIGGKNLDQSQFEKKVIQGTFSPNQIFALNAFQDTGVKITQPCYSKTGCPCQEEPLKILCEYKYCKTLQCVEPIKPEGHCCDMCGGFLLFDINEDFDMAAFKDLVENTFNEYGGQNKLAYHIGKLGKSRVQLVVVDKGEGISTKMVYAVDANMKTSWAPGFKEKHTSFPLSETGLAGRIVLAGCVLVVLCLLGIFLVYNRMPIRHPFVFPPWRPRHLPTIGVLSRFQRRTESVVSLTRRDSQPLMTDSTTTATAFRNPLYDSQRGSGPRMEQVQEAATTDTY